MSAAKDYIVFEQHGFGVMESPHKEGKTLGIFTGTEKEVVAYCAAETLKIHGGKLTGWDSPTISYKPVVRLN